MLVNIRYQLTKISKRKISTKQKNGFIIGLSGKRNSYFSNDHNVPEYKSNEILFYDELLARSDKVMNYLNLVNSRNISVVRMTKLDD